MKRIENIFSSEKIYTKYESAERRKSADDVITKTVVKENILNISLLSEQSIAIQELPKDTLSDNMSTSQLFSNHQQLEDEIKLIDNKEIKCYFSKKSMILAGSILAGIGTGLAMMPIFNKEVKDLEEFGIDIHDSIAPFVVSTVNTLLVMGTCSALSIYKYFTTQNEEEQDLTKLEKVMLKAGKVGAVFNSVLPVSMLWNIELNDQKISDSSGFDGFVAWATFTTIPLMIYKSLEGYEQFERTILGKHSLIDLESIGSKIAVYGTTILSAFARGISFTAATTELCKNIGFDDTTSKTLGILIGGVAGSVATGISEYPLIKELFKKQEQPLTKRQILTGCIAVSEGMWFALPSVGVGLDVVKGWNGLLKGGIFAPYFLARTIVESKTIYNTCN